VGNQLVRDRFLQGRGGEVEGKSEWIKPIVAGPPFQRKLLGLDSINGEVTEGVVGNNPGAVE